MLGQDRAVEAARFGADMQGRGYNIFALGPLETDKNALLTQFFERRAADAEPPADQCYVNDFTDEHTPRFLSLPSGRGRLLHRAMKSFVEDLPDALRSAFEGEEYQARRQNLEQEAQSDQAEGLERLQEEAAERGLRMVRTPTGFGFAAVRDGEVLPPEQLEQLPEEEQEDIRKHVDELQEQLREVMRRIPSQQRELRQSVRELDRSVARGIVEDMVRGVRERFEELPAVQSFLDDVVEDVVGSARNLVRDQEAEQPQAQMLQARQAEEMLRRYRVNVLVSCDDADGAPVVHEQNPTYENLVGRIEYRAEMGALTTDFNLIQPGALHRANGGTLIVDARRLLSQPLAWQALKRTLRSGEIAIESPGKALGLIQTRSLDPEPIPLDVKVVLLGERRLYMLMYALDPEFAEFFKVQADFEDEMDRSSESQRSYARLIATMVRRDALPAFDREAVARVIEQSARIASDAEKLSMRTRTIRDLLHEAALFAGRNGNGNVRREDVQAAIDAQVRRADRLRERTIEAVVRDTIRLDTTGERVGQVNGLSVVKLGDFGFGRATRITATVRVGDGDIVDIEREAELGGSLHAKGVMILSGFLKGRYATDTPFSLSASLVFEQSYGPVEGDSASLAELFALLSAIADMPLRQSLAVTGSVDQHGSVQAVGGINEKIEGFYDVCAARGLTGDQGVLIPEANAVHLMLRHDVVDAVERGDFQIYALQRVDQGMALLTGVPMGERDSDGAYPKNSVNGAIHARLEHFARRLREARARPGHDLV